MNVAAGRIQPVAEAFADIRKEFGVPGNGMTYFVVVTQKAKDDLRHHDSVAAYTCPRLPLGGSTDSNRLSSRSRPIPRGARWRPRMTSLTNPCINSSTENAPDDTELSLPSRMIVFLCSTLTRSYGQSGRKRSARVAAERPFKQERVKGFRQQAFIRRDLGYPRRTSGRTVPREDSSRQAPCYGKMVRRIRRREMGKRSTGDVSQERNCGKTPSLRRQGNCLLGQPKNQNRRRVRTATSERWQSMAIRRPSSRNARSPNSGRRG